MNELTPALIAELRAYYDELKAAAAEAVETLNAASTDAAVDYDRFHVVQNRADLIMRAIFAMQDR